MSDFGVLTRRYKGLSSTPNCFHKLIVRMCRSIRYLMLLKRRKEKPKTSPQSIPDTENTVLYIFHILSEHDGFNTNLEEWYIISQASIACNAFLNTYNSEYTPL